MFDAKRQASRQVPPGQLPPGQVPPGGNLSKGELVRQQQQKKTEHVPTAEKRICIAFLKGIVKEALGDQKDFPDVLLYDLLENKDILATIVALKRAFTNKAEGAMATARLKLLKLLGNAR